MATFVGKMGVASGDIVHCTRKLLIREELSPFANVSSELEKNHNSRTFLSRIIPVIR